MRRKDREISHSESVDILEKGEYGVLSMCTPGGEAYGIPINYVVYNFDIYLHCAKEGSKIDYLRANNQVSFCVVGKTTVLPASFGTQYESVIATGTACEVEGLEKLEALKQFIQKYSNEFIPEGNEYIAKLLDRVCVIRLTVESITGKSRKQ